MSEPTQRIFVAIYPSQEVIRKLKKESETLKKRLPENLLRWLPEENWHITLKFFGNLTAKEVEQLDQNLRFSLKAQRTVAIQLTSITWFPSGKKPSVLAAIANGSPELNRLAMNIHNVDSQHEKSAGNKPYRPHLSLARCRQKRPINAHSSLPLNITPVAFTANQVHLVKSQTLATGATYTKLASYPLLT